MLLTTTESLRAAAAQPTLETIRRHRAAASRELAPLLAYIEEHLFDADFTIHEMRRACNARDNSVVTRFRRVLGMTPTQFVKTCRLEVAAELLRRTRLEVWKIADLVGYSSPQLLTRHFRQQFAAPPDAYRRALNEAAAGDPETDTPGGGEPFQTVELRQALDGYLEPRRAEALMRRLDDLYRRDAGDSRPGPAVGSEIWQALQRLPREGQVAADRESLAAGSRGLFELLRQASLEVGRRNRRLGVRLAELALVSLEESSAELGEELASLKALGWACVGHARRLALDHSGAEEAFREANDHCRISGPSVDRGVEGEICSLESAFRVVQHRFGEAKILADRSVSLLQESRHHRLLAKTLIVRGTIAGYERDLEASTTNLSQALKLVDHSDRRLRLSVCHNLAAAYATAEHYEEAANLLPTARQLCSSEIEPLLRYQVLWLEGLVARGLGDHLRAESRFIESREGFLELGERGYRAVVGLDLAQIYSAQGRSEVIAVAGEAIPILEEFKIRHEALTAAKILANAVAG